MRSPVLSRLVFFVPLLTYVIIYFVDGTGSHPSGDGFYSWIFARSLAFDGDLDFANDYALCGDPFGVGLVRETGRADNPFYIGPAFFWLGPLLVLRAVARLVHAGPHVSCGSWLTALTILAGPVCGAISVWLSYRSARLYVRPGIAATTALVFAFSSPLFPYSTGAAHYSHVYLTCVVAVVAYISLRAIARGRSGTWDGVWLFLAMAVAVVHRLPAALYVVIPGASFVALALRGTPPWRSLLGALSGIAAGALETFLLYDYLYGTWLALPQGPHYVHLAHAHPWLLLFGVHGGFFFWMPAAWLAVAGAFIARRRAGLRLFVLAALSASVAEVFVSSTPLDWHGNWSLGARRLLPLTPIVIVLAAVALARLDQGVRTRIGARTRLIVAIGATLLVLIGNIPAATTMRGDRELSQRALYGALSPFALAWGALDGAGLDLALLPAELYFALRYRLPTRAYRTVMKPWFRRDFLTLESADVRLDLRAPEAELRMTNGAWSERGMKLSDAEARLVSATEWPFATHLRLLLESPQPARVTIAAGRTFGRAPIGAADIPPSADPVWIELVLPPGVYDSGINDWILSTDGGPVLLAAVELEDRTPRVPHGTRSKRPVRSLDRK